MTRIEIRDLEMEKELNDKAMADVFGGCPDPNNLPDGTAILGGGSGYLVMANPFDPFTTIMGRLPRIPSWFWGRVEPWYPLQ